MPDALGTMTALAREGLWLGTERLSRQLGRPTGIPGTAADIDAQWMTDVLQEEFPGARVATIECLQRDAGTTDRARLGLAYEEKGHGNQPPASVFVKLSPADAKTRLFGNMFGLGENEVRFYREVASNLPVRMPLIYRATLHGRARRFVLVLEDLAARNVRFNTVSDRATVEDARSVVTELARLHAAFWASPRLSGELGWLRAPGRSPRLAVERFICAASVRPALARFPDVVPSEVSTAIPRIVSARNALEAAWGRGPLTLIHGDSHIGNMYFEDGRAGFFDWQVVQRGQGMRDVSYFLVNSVPTDVRVEHQRELIAHYIATLAEHGVTGPAPEEAWQQHRLHALYTLMGTLVTAAGTKLQARAIARAGLARASKAVLDLDSIGALDALG